MTTTGADTAKENLLTLLNDIDRHCAEIGRNVGPYDKETHDQIRKIYALTDRVRDEVNGY